MLGVSHSRQQGLLWADADTGKADSTISSWFDPSDTGALPVSAQTSPALSTTSTRPMRVVGSAAPSAWAAEVCATPHYHVFGTSECHQLREVAEHGQFDTERLPNLQESVDKLTAKVDSLSAEVKERPRGSGKTLAKLEEGVLALPCSAMPLWSPLGWAASLSPKCHGGIILGFSRLAASYNEPADDVKSFQQADLILYVSDDQGNPRYLAIEASFTVAGRDAPSPGAAAERSPPA